jgi:hypothetical protein
MGMIRSKITIVDDLSNINASTGAPAYKIPADKVAIASIKDGVQNVQIDMDGTTFSPAIVVVQKEVQTQWTINAKKVTDGNKTLVFPLYNAQLDITEGENKIGFIPDPDFDFSTFDNKFFGYVKVVDDINNVDIEAIKREVKNYAPQVNDNVDESGLPSCCGQTNSN